MIEINCQNYLNNYLSKKIVYHHKENCKNENCYQVSNELKFKDVKSLWIHFEKFLSRIKVTRDLRDNEKFIANEWKKNKRTENLLGRRRLDVFVRLGNGEEIK